MLSVGKSCQSRICNSEVEGEVEVIVTVFVGDHSLTTEVSTEQRACVIGQHIVTPLRGPDHRHLVQGYHRKRRELIWKIQSQLPQPLHRRPPLHPRPEMGTLHVVIPLPLLCQRQELLSGGHLAQTRDVELLVIGPV